MITDKRIRELIALGNENRNLDYKGPFSWATVEKDEKLGVVKDVLSFSNTRDGGIMLIGVDDKTGHHVGLSEEESSSFDQTKFNDFLHVYTDPKHTCNVYRRLLDGKKIVVIEVPEFADVPILCKQTAGSTSDPKTVLLRKAALYKRTEKASSEIVQDSDEMRELINRALLRRQDELLTAMNRIINPQRQPGGSAETKNYEGEVGETDEFIAAKIGAALQAIGHWTVTFQPSTYAENRMAELRAVQARVRAAQVTLRGRNFPHLTSANDSNFGRGFQSWIDWKGPMNRYLEGFRAYQSGLFRWKGALWEESAEGYADRNVLEWVGIVFDFTEWLLFAQRYYEQILDIGDQLRVEFVLSKAQGRRLVSPPNTMPLWNSYTSREDRVVLQETVEIVELRTDSEGVARRLTRKALELFNWNNVSDDNIVSRQKQYTSGRF